MAEGGRRVAQSQTLGEVAHVDLFPVEDAPQVFREGRVEADPRDVG